MNNRQQRIKARARVARDNLRRHGALPPAIARMADKLDERIAALEAAHQEQNIASKEVQYTAERGSLLRATVRRKQMIPISRSAKVHFANEPGVLAAMRVPHATALAEELADAADGMVKALEPWNGYLVEEGFASDFLTRLGDDAKELRQLAEQAVEARRRRSVATRTLAAELRALRAVYVAIDGQVTAHEDQHPKLAGAWRSVRPIGKRIGRPTARAVAARKKRA